MTRLNEETLGRYFVDERGELWQHIGYADRPSATMQKVKDPAERRGGCVGSPILDGFVMLEPQTASPNPPANHHTERKARLRKP